jgi:OOP family OmpA-OmpF porin
MRRASAVRDYLASKEIPLNRISVDGKGKTQPVTKPGDCKGPKSAKVIACLQPDRRVVVEVTGSK